MSLYPLILLCGLQNQLIARLGQIYSIMKPD
jgi:hypothetical protein